MIGAGIELARELMAAAAEPARVEELDAGAAPAPAVIQIRTYSGEEIAGLAILVVVGGAVVVLVAAFIYAATVKRTPRWIRCVKQEKKKYFLLKCWNPV